MSIPESGICLHEVSYWLSTLMQAPWPLQALFLTCSTYPGGAEKLAFGIFYAVWLPRPSRTFLCSLASLTSPDLPMLQHPAYGVHHQSSVCEAAD